MAGKMVRIGIDVAYQYVISKAFFQNSLAVFFFQSQRVFDPIKKKVFAFSSTKVRKSKCSKHEKYF